MTQVFPEANRSRKMRTGLVTQFLILASLLMSATLANPRRIRAASDDLDPDYVTVSTKYGSIRGRNYNATASLDLNIFLGVPYAQPPTGELRLARPEPIQPWSPVVRDATEHGAKCVQRIIGGDPVLEGVPFSEDCLFLDIYTTRNTEGPDAKKPVMVYLHPGGYYGGSGAKYNFTNLAMKGVVAVSVSFRLDMFGFLSTQDDVIPGNFGLLDAAQALDFIKEIISDFGGNPEEITLFGASSGAAMVSIFTLSPLTRGKFSKAIIQSGGALCPWAVFTPGRTVNVPADVALSLGRRLNCSLPDATSTPGANVSRDLLTCLRATPVDTLVQESVAMQREEYRSDMVFIPVTGDSFGFLPETPESLLAKTDELIPVPTIIGFTTNDGSWLVPDSEDDGISYPELQFILNAFIRQYFPPDQVSKVLESVTKAYLPSTAASLAPVQLRAILVKMATDAAFAAPLIKEARQFAAAAAGAGESANKPGTFVYRFNHRPSYSTSPYWYRVGHADEKGFVLGLTPGPDPFNYPNTTLEDQFVADLVTTMWTDFAKFGNPTPQPFSWPQGVRWPVFGHAPDHQELLVIDLEPRVDKLDNTSSSVAVWTGESGLVQLDSGGQSQANVGLLSFAVLNVMILWKFNAL